MTARRSRPMSRRAPSIDAPIFESLEERRLLTTLYGGQSLTFKDAEDNSFLVTLGGNIEAEFVFAAYDTSGFAMRPAGPIPAFSDLDGRDLFSIYVTRSTPQSYISVVQITEGGVTPFGDPASIRVRNATTGMLTVITGADESGAGYLGGRTRADGEARDIPLLAIEIPSTGFGVIPPQPSNIVRAGVSVNGGSTLGRFIFDGTVTGFANFTGSIGDFYCGNLFTGDTRGSFPTAPTGIFADNFNVLGDVRNILVKGFVGTDEAGTSTEPDYLSGFDLQVRGSLGQFRAASHIAGKVDVRNVLAGPFLNLVQDEIEFSSISLTSPLPTGEFGGDEFFNNDTFDTPQYLASIPDPVFGGTPGVRVTGTVDPLTDPTDFYSVPLVAGQSIIVQSVGSAGETSAPLLGVFDPDGRLIASNYNDVDPGQTLGKPFQFTADRPGNYRFSVGTITTVPAGTGAATGFTVTSPNYGSYSIRVQFGGNTGIGAIVTDDGNYLDLGQEPGIAVWRGDFGALELGGTIPANGTLISNSSATISVPFGNLRVVRGQNLGNEGGDSAFGLNALVPFGTVGLVQSTLGTLGFNTLVTTPVGGNIQILDAATQLFGGVQDRDPLTDDSGIRTNRAIGIIRAGSVAGGIFIEVNADDIGRDGIISLIDVTGDFGSSIGGGPQISTNLGGNVGYMRVLGDVYRDSRFGSGLGTASNTIVVPSGQNRTITDDSGTLVNIAPVIVPNPNYNPNNPTSSPFIGKPADFTVVVYPVFGSGGSAIVRVTTDRTLIFSSSNPSRDVVSAEIGQVIFTDRGADVILEDVIQPGTGTGVGNPAVITDTRPILDPEDILDISLYVQGPRPISILDVLGGTRLGTPGLANPARSEFNYNLTPLNTIQNTSGGELPIIRASSIGNLYGSMIGAARKTAAGTALLPREIIADNYPFVGERVGVLAHDIINVGATENVGNVIVQTDVLGPFNQQGGGDGATPAANSGTIGAITPDVDRKDLTNVFEGITGSILAHELRYVDVGEGVAAGGSGFDNQAGIFANGAGRIRLITNRGRGDIRGPVVATTRINAISLTNGSIINANIGVLTALSDISDFHGLITVPSSADPIDNPGYELGPITLTGNGGIIGSFIAASDIDNIRVNGGFGIFYTAIISAGLGRINRIIADGYGIRGAVVSGGGSLTELNATGDGRQLNSEQYTFQTRLSEFGYRIDPFFGIGVSRLTDIHSVLGTTKNNRIIENVTNSGIIEDTLAEGAVDLNAVYAQRIRRSEFNFADRIDRFQTRGPVRQVDITTGRLRNYIIAGDVAQSVVNVAGPIENFYITGSLDAASNVQAIGASGRIDRFQVLKFLAGDVRTTGVLNVLAVGRDILSTSRVEADEIPTRYIGGQIFGQIVIT